MAHPAHHDLMWRQLGDVLSVKPQLSVLAPQQSGDHAQRRSLARSIGADQRHYLSRSDLEGNVEQRLEIAIAGAHIVHGEESVTHKAISLYLLPR